jgi:hypothetical protein
MSTPTRLDPPEEPAWQPHLVLLSSTAALVLVVAVGLRLREHPERAGEPPIVLYLVDAQDQAQIIDDALDAATAILAASGEPTPTHQVRWFTSAVVEAAF